jgi:hypothetical protein
MMEPPEFMAVAGVIIATTVILRPIAKGIAARLAGGRPDDARLSALESDLRHTRLQLLETREQVEHMGEKTAFLENLLAEPAGVGELPRPRS